MRLMRNLVQISTEEAEETFDGGVIFKPDSLKVKPNTEGTVMAIGPKVNTVSIGQRVLYGKFSAQELEDSVLVHEDDIIAIMEDNHEEKVQ